MGSVVIGSEGGGETGCEFQVVFSVHGFFGSSLVLNTATYGASHKQFSTLYHRETVMLKQQPSEVIFVYIETLGNQT